MRELPTDSIIALILIGIFITLCIIGMVRGAKNRNGRSDGPGGSDGGVSASGGGDGGCGDGGGGGDC